MSKQNEAKQEEQQLTRAEILKQIEANNPYAEYESVTTTKAIKSPSSNREKYKAYVHKAMEEGIKKFGVKVENQKIFKTSNKNGKKTRKTTLFSGYCFIEETTHEEKGKEFEFCIPQLYVRGSGNNVIKRVCNEEKQIVEDYHITLGLIPVEDNE